MTTDPGKHSFSEPPLIVDLDGTLCRSDTLDEAALGLLLRQQGLLLRLPGWLRSGKDVLKRQIADRMLLDPALLPYNDEVIDMIGAARRQGRRVELVSAADHRQVQAVAAHLGLFDDSVGTGSAGSEGNLRAERKAAFLTARHGPKGFDYVGDSAADLAVWQAARHGYGVELSPALRRKADNLGVQVAPLTGSSDRRSGWPVRALVRASRPYQWAKNVLILLPVLTAQQLPALLPALLAMLCFSLAASAVYLINDLVDLPADRAHPRKRLRPFAAGSASARQGLALAAGLLLLSLGLSVIVLPPAFSLVLVTYLVLTSAYSFWLKRKMVVDVIVLAVLYTLRIIAGSAATGIVLSPWLLVFSMFLFFALATLKRQAELEDIIRRGEDRSTSRNLEAGDLPILQAMSIGAAQAAVLVFALYSQDAEVQTHFANPDLLLLICPVLFLWLGRMQMMTRRGYMTDDPIVFTFRDRVSLACGAVMLALFVLAARS